MTTHLPSNLDELRKYSKRIVDRNLAVGPGGNTSIRVDRSVWISPSGFPLDEISDSDWVEMDLETGNAKHHRVRPSSEYQMHLEIYRHRPDVMSVVHAHPPYVIGVISSGFDSIPFLFPDHVAIARDVRTIDYVVPCTPELAKVVRDAISEDGVGGLLMKNHGLVMVGNNVREAYYRAEIIEDAARVFWIATSIGTPNVLSHQQAEEIAGLEAERYRNQLLAKPPPT